MRLVFKSVFLVLCFNAGIANATTTLNLRIIKAPEYYPQSTIEIATYDNFGYRMLYELPLRDTTYLINFKIDEPLICVVLFPVGNERVILNPGEDVEMTIHIRVNRQDGYTWNTHNVTFNGHNINQLRLKLDSMELYQNGFVHYGKGRRVWSDRPRKTGWAYTENTESKRVQRFKILQSKDSILQVLEFYKSEFKDDDIAQQLIFIKEYDIKLHYYESKYGYSSKKYYDARGDLWVEYNHELGKLHPAFMMPIVERLVFEQLQNYRFYKKGIRRVINEKSILEAYLNEGVINQDRLDSIQ